MIQTETALTPLNFVCPGLMLELELELELELAAGPRRARLSCPAPGRNARRSGAGREAKKRCPSPRPCCNVLRQSGREIPACALPRSPCPAVLP